MVDFLKEDKPEDERKELFMAQNRDDCFNFFQALKEKNVNIKRDELF